MTDKTQQAAALADILGHDPHALASALVSNADGHDDRLDLLKSLLALTAAVADAVSDDMSAVGDGYDVCSQTGETHDGNGTEGEGRGHALHQYACAAACCHVEDAIIAAEVALEKRLEAANTIADEVTADEYLAAIAAL